MVAQGIRNADVGREAHKIHVSEVTKEDSCPRMLYYKVTGAERTDVAKSTGHQLQIIWSAGHDAHHKWQRWLQEMGDLWGTWKCLSCEDEWIDTSPECCRTCGKILLKYQEVNLEHEDYLLVGHADGAVPRLNSFVEVKSFSVGTVRVDNAKLVNEHTHKIDGRTVVDHDGLWKAINRPLKSHLKQGMMYLWLAKQMGLPYDRIVFIYEFKSTQATKTFEVRLSERILAEPLAILAEVQDHVARGVVPERPRLFAPDAKPCNTCPFKSGCWGLKVDDNDEESAAVSPGGSGAGGEEASGGTEVPAATEADSANSRGARGHHRSTRQATDRDDDQPDPVGRAPRRAVGNRGGGRAVGRGGNGEVPSPRFARRVREGRNSAEG